jgi:hypothetical protein
MRCARLFYWGGEDRQVAKRFRRLGGQLAFQDVDFIECPGFDHAGCNTPSALEKSVLQRLRAGSGNALDTRGNTPPAVTTDTGVPTRAGEYRHHVGRLRSTKAARGVLTCRW